jgi:hypothetical protein
MAAAKPVSGISALGSVKYHATKVGLEPVRPRRTPGRPGSHLAGTAPRQRHPMRPQHSPVGGVSQSEVRSTDMSRTRIGPRRVVRPAWR